jgi:type IV secretory pathway TraG/TraD family ATPase VirD4
MAVAFLALLAVPGFLDAFSSLRSALVASLCLFLVLLLWFQRRRIPERPFALMLGVAILGAVVLIWNADQIKRPRNIWQFLTLADHTPWTSGHTLGAAFGIAATVALWKPKNNQPKRPEDSEEILSGPRLISMTEAQDKARHRFNPSEGSIFWGGLNLPEHCSTEHFAIVGTPGSGKTLSLHLLMKSVLPRLTGGANRRAVIYDAKRDTCSILAGMLAGMETAPPVYVLNPFDLRTSPWQMNRDIREGATAYEIASILIAKTGSESQPFFLDASRALLGGVMHAFAHLAPDAWTLRDVILTMRHTRRITAVIASCPQTEYLLAKYVTGSTRDNDIEATLETVLRGLSFVAAAWHHSDKEPVSLDQWMRSESILILGADPSFDHILQALNRAIFKRLVELVRRQPDVKRGETRQAWFIIDELRNAGNLEDIDKLLVEGRSKGACVVLGFQDLAGLREVFGEKRADEIIGACANKVFLQNGDGTTIDYATKHFKSQEILETRVSQSRNEALTGQGGTSEGYNISRQRVTRPVVHEGLLKSLPKPSPGRDGLSGYCDTAAVGTLFPYRMELSPDFLDRELPRADESGILPIWSALA